MLPIRAARAPAIAAESAALVSALRIAALSAPRARHLRISSFCEPSPTVTTTSPERYEELARVMRSEPLDFIGVDYAVDNREVEATILPLARERGIGVLVYLPFGRTRLWARVKGREVPEWAAELDAHTWAQFFLKFVVAHPAVTVATPATSSVEHMIDDLGAAVGRLPDEAMRRRMAEHVAALPG